MSAKCKVQSTKCKVQSAKCKVQDSARTYADYWLWATDYSGFTLLEVLVASAILSLVLAALYGVFGQTLTSKRLAEERAQQARWARITLLRIGEDLQSALPPTSREMQFLSETSSSQELPEDTLSFVTLTRAALTTRTPEGDLSEITYALEPDPTASAQKQLVRRVRFMLSSQRNVADEVAPLLPRVHGLRFRFFDGREWQEEWRQEQTQNQLPQAVETTVYVADSQKKIWPFSTVVTVPLSETKRGKVA